MRYNQDVYTLWSKESKSACEEDESRHSPQKTMIRGDMSSVVKREG